MCGIAGIISLNQRAVSLDSLKGMTNAIAHRGPDGDGHWLNSSAEVGLGHRRLSIIDLSEGGKQPMHYADGRYSITFNGEIYNYVELKETLKQKGYRFQSSSDTEVLLALYDLKKEKCLHDLDGMFAFAIWDEKEKKLFCARDRFGEKPFYYYKDNSFFAFASEIKGLFAYGIDKKVSLKRIHYYLTYKIDTDPNAPHSTFYDDIFQLEPAHYMTVDTTGNVLKKRYWDIDITKTNNISFESAVEKFTELFQCSIKRRLRSDVAVGSSLSGGLDSSSIVLYIDSIKNQGQVQKTFSARFKNFEKDEGEYIQMVIDKAKAVEAHFTWPDENVFINELDKVFYHQDEPFISTSVLAQWEVMKLAREHNTTVLIDGQGADEILAGYKPLYKSYLNQLYAGFNSRYKNESQRYAEFHNEKHQLSFNAKFMLRFPTVFNAISEIKKAGRENRNTTAPGFPAAFGNYHSDFQEQIKSMYDPSKKINDDNLKRSQKLILQEGGFLPLLRYADRNSMAFSRELRLPFLYHELVEFVFTLPDDFKINNGWSKYIQRKAMEKYLPEKITWRRDKVGYEAPQLAWMQSKQAKEMVRASKENLMKNHILSHQNINTDDWSCLMVSKLFT